MYYFQRVMYEFRCWDGWPSLYISAMCWIKSGWVLFTSYDKTYGSLHFVILFIWGKGRGASLRTGGVLFTSGLFDVNCCTHIGVISSGLFYVIVDVRCPGCRHLSSWRFIPTAISIDMDQHECLYYWLYLWPPLRLSLILSLFATFTRTHVTLC